MEVLVKTKKAGVFIADKFWEGIVFLIGIFFLLASKLLGRGED